MTGHFTTSLNYETYLAANWLMVRRRWIWRGALRYTAIMAGVFTVISALDVKSDEWDALRIFSVVATGLLLAVIVMGAQWVAFRFMIPRSARKTWSQLHLDGLPTSHEFDGVGIRISNDRGTSNFEWHMLTSWTENDDLLLMFRTKLMFHAVPKAQVSPEVLQSLRAQLIEAGVSTRC